MSTVQRPGAVRRPTGPAATPQTSTSRGPSPDEVNALPEFEDGQAIDLDPAKANDGGFGAGDGTTVKIVSARFGKFQYPGRTDIAAEVRLFVEFQIPGSDKPRIESFKYADFSRFTASKDGNTVVVRPSAIKANKDGSNFVPNVYKYDKGVLFMQSVTNAGKAVGLTAEKLNKEGAKALVGLMVHVRKQRVAGMSDGSKPALLVDYINAPGAASNASGNATVAAPNVVVAPVTNQTVAAPAAADTAAVDEITVLATEALSDLLEGSEGKTMSKAHIPTKLIQNEKWKTHEHRGKILQKLREADFVEHADRNGKVWFVDGANIVKL